MKNSILALLALVLTALLSTPSSAQRTEEWDDATIDMFATLPVQNGGRVKPLESLAGLRLLMLNGKRTLKLESGEKLGPSAWMLEAIFFPDDARNEPCIRVENSEVLIGVGLDGKRKRDWYSYNDLKGARAAINREARAAFQKDPKERSAVERLTAKLDMDLSNFESLLGMMEPLRLNFDVSASPRLVEIVGGSIVRSPLDAMRVIDDLVTLQSSTDPAVSADKIVLQSLFAAIDRARSSGGRGPTLAPPVPELAKGDAWWTVGDLVDVSMLSLSPEQGDISKQLEILGLLEQMELHKLDRAAFLDDLTHLHGVVEAMATASGDYKHVRQEVSLYRIAPFYKALVCFGIGFLLMAASFLSEKLRPLNWIVWALALAGFGYLAYGVVMRSVIRERPPVVTLYDTITFITAVAVLVALVMAAFLEWTRKLRVALAVALIFGIVGMFLAGKYELKEIASAGDTMASVVAVLDTNYYLAIHVTTVAIGYSGGLLAALIAHVWILGKLFRIREDDKAFYKSITRMVYGVLCFSLFFALFGTVMGGIWANDSWGRFWGWDPKENGALLIVLWLLLTLHARMGGYIRDRGMAVMAIATGCVVAASWWGVNLLGVGLHSYGFTSGVFFNLAGFWTFEILIMALSLYDSNRRKHQAAIEKAVASK